jgi:crotonobetaine/carnitine-CoA ligase
VGVQFGDRVAVVLPNEQVAALAVFACARLGAIQVPLNTFLRGEFLRYQLGDSQASVVITDRLGLEQIREMASQLADLQAVILVGDIDPDQFSDLHLACPLVAHTDLMAADHDGHFPLVTPESTHMILYTSGTTGMPKGCLISHSYATSIANTLCDIGRFETGDRVLTPSPLFHASGQIFAMLSALRARGSIAIERQFHASTFMADAGDLGATALFAAGAVGAMLLAQPHRDTDHRHQVRRALFNGLPAEAQFALEARFGFRVIGEMYGHTEFVPITANRTYGPNCRESGGRPLPDVEVQVVDQDDLPVPAGQVGEIVARGRRPGLMFDGYWNNPQATVETWRNLWHHTGDLGRFDTDGFLHFVDRKKEAIRRRGEFVTARELESAIAKHPDVDAVAVHAVASELTEDEIKAWLVPAPGASLEPVKLFAFFREQLPYFAIPRYVEVIDRLPTNQYARVMKHELKARPNDDNTWDFQQLGLVVPRDERRGPQR